LLIISACHQPAGNGASAEEFFFGGSRPYTLGWCLKPGSDEVVRSTASFKSFCDMLTQAMKDGKTFNNIVISGHCGGDARNPRGPGVRLCAPGEGQPEIRFDLEQLKNYKDANCDVVGLIKKALKDTGILTLCSCGYQEQINKKTEKAWDMELQALATLLGHKVCACPVDALPDPAADCKCMKGKKEVEKVCMAPKGDK
jgi:hypothetical protein